MSCIFCGLSQPALVRALAGVASWERFDGRSRELIRVDPPARHAMVLFDSNTYLHLPVLNGLTRQPYFRPDGSLTKDAGYDTSTGMFGVFAEKKFIIPESPTKQDAEAALALINDLLIEFSFANESDRSAALAALLTAACRPSLQSAPMFHVKASQIASGKTYLCALITAFATPQHGKPASFPKDDEECRKLLLAELLRAPAVIEFDNLTGDLYAHKSLCICLTSEFFSGRILGISKTVEVGTKTLFLSSGNNVVPVQDMIRRCITIDLDPACETPATRVFKRPNLLDDVRKEREYYVSAALTIIRAWVIAGRPKTECKSIASYGEWADLCRQSLLWLGQADPATSMFESMADDPERETLGRMLTIWKAHFGNKPTMVRDVVKTACEEFSNLDTLVDIEELKEILIDIAGENGRVINRNRLGHWIKRNAKRTVDGLRFEPAGGSRSASAWCVKSVS